MVGRGRGVHTEVLLSLAVVIVTATVLLTAFLLKTHASEIERLRDLIGSGLATQVRSPTFDLSGGPLPAHWWTLNARGRIVEGDAMGQEIDEASIALAAEARARATPLLRTGAPWEPIRFALPRFDRDDVVVARIPAAVSGFALASLLVADITVLAIFGGYLLWRRVVVPVRELATAARNIAAGAYGTRIAVEGVSETADVAVAFNEMSEALEKRTRTLEKVVEELKDSNTSLREARAGLDRAERLAAVGQLAAGVAHEVGNPMGAMLAFLEMARRDESVSPDARAHLEKAQAQGERVRVILRQLLDFSRPPRAERGPVDLQRVARQVVALIRAQKKYEEVELDVVSNRAVVSAQADESMVSQILLNLVLNAADAVCGQEAGRVVLEIDVASEHSGSPGAVHCRVRDNGPGVDAENRERIFDPFFTSKPPGEGTGLGLANAQRLAEELNGTLELEEAGERGGAVFTLRLPLGAQI